MQNKYKLLLFCIVLLLSGITVLGCGKKFYSGTYEKGLSHFPKDVPISPQKAVELASPYLDLSYKLFKGNRTRQSDCKIETNVFLDDKYYYIVRSDMNYIAVQSYLPYAIIVDKKTGEIQIPKQTNDK